MQRVRNPDRFHVRHGGRSLLSESLPRQQVGRAPELALTHPCAPVFNGAAGAEVVGQFRGIPRNPWLRIHVPRDVRNSNPALPL